MNLFRILSRDDYLMIKWPIVYAAVGIILAISIYMGVDYLSSESRRSLLIAQSDFDNARTRVDQIEEEEATIIEYIGRYQTLDSSGAIRDEDRLLMFERVAEIRSANNLFPVSLNISEQSSLRLNYPAGIREPGGPIALRSSVIGLSLPLLHEADLTRLLDGILNSPGLYQTSSCTLDQQNSEITSFIVLSQHFQANCEIFWYTFDLDPPLDNSFGF